MTELEPDADPLEWDADDVAGDEDTYDGLAAETTPYTPDAFDVVTDKEEIDLDDN